MNLLDHERTPMWRVFERVRDLRGELPRPPSGTRSSSGWRRSRAFLDTADHIGVAATLPRRRRGSLAAAQWLAIRDASPDMALELRLAARGRVSRLTGG